MGIKALRCLCEVKVSAWVRRTTDKALCVCVSGMVEWNPCQCLESLSSLLSWINGKVTVCTDTQMHARDNTQADSHTYQLCSVLPQWQGHCHTLFRCLMKTHRHAWLSLPSHKYTPLWGKYTNSPPSRHLNLFQLSNVWFRRLVLKHAETQIVSEQLFLKRRQINL